MSNLLYFIPSTVLILSISFFPILYQKKYMSNLLYFIPSTVLILSIDLIVHFHYKNDDPHDPSCDGIQFVAGRHSR